MVIWYSVCFASIFYRIRLETQKIPSCWYERWIFVQYCLTAPAKWKTYLWAKVGHYCNDFTIILHTDIFYFRICPINSCMFAIIRQKEFPFCRISKNEMLKDSLFHYSILRTPGPVPFWTCIMFYLLRLIFFPNLLLFFWAMLFEYPSVLFRFCLANICFCWWPYWRKWAYCFVILVSWYIGQSVGFHFYYH